MRPRPVTRTICIANQKGGVGKTTTAINLAGCLARGGSEVLLIDLDPQCNATSGLGKRPSERHALVESSTIRGGMVTTDIERLRLIPGSRSFKDAEFLAQGTPERGDLLRQHLENGLTGFDYVLIDCPPSVGPLTQVALAASKEVLMPIQCEFFAMEGLTQMISVIRKIMQHKPGRLAFCGIVLTMVDHTLELATEVEDEVREFFGELVFETVVPRDVAVAEAAGHGRPVLEYAPRSRGSRAYIELCMEVTERV